MRYRNYLRVVPLAVTNLLYSSAYASLEDSSSQLNEGSSASSNINYSGLEKAAIAGGFAVMTGTVIGLCYWESKKRRKSSTENKIKEVSHRTDIETVYGTERETRRF